MLSPQPSVLEWRLIGPALRQVVAKGDQVIVVGPPKHPHLPGLAHEGLDQRHLVWIQADAPAERLWVTEQLIRSNAAGTIVSWWPQARQKQIRRFKSAPKTAMAWCSRSAPNLHSTKPPQRPYACTRPMAWIGS